MEIMLVGICPCKARGKHEKKYISLLSYCFLFLQKFIHYFITTSSFVETARSVICLMFSPTTGSRFQAHR